MKRYIWNNHLLRTTLEKQDVFLVQLVRGFAESRPVGGDQVMTVVSRIDHRNAGTRFTVRGLNGAGDAAMSVESELIIESSYSIASHLQYRASLPLRWTQNISQLAYKPPVYIQPDNAYTTEAHFKDINNNILPGKIHILNLLRTSEDESALSQALASKLEQTKPINVFYHPLPLGWGVVSLNQVVDQMELPLKQNGHFFAHIKNKQLTQIIQLQTGIIRTNCMDCMDRTSIAQFGLINRLLPHLIDSYALPTLRQLWANNANALATYYTGTGIVNEPIIRSGMDTPNYSHKDQLICGTRYFLNNTHDSSKKAWLDRFLNLKIHPSSQKISHHPAQLTIHLKKWQEILGPPPPYSQPAVSGSLIDNLSPHDLQVLSAKFLSDLLKLASLSDYCLIHNINSDLLLERLFHCS